MCLGGTFDRSHNPSCTSRGEPVTQPTTKIVRINLECTTNATEATQPFFFVRLDPFLRLPELLLRHRRGLVGIAEIAIHGILEDCPQETEFPTRLNPNGHGIAVLDGNNLRERYVLLGFFVFDHGPLLPSTSPEVGCLIMCVLRSTPSLGEKSHSPNTRKA